jgi:pyruvate ferredoxin oxidoreductase gamma subunit
MKTASRVLGTAFFRRGFEVQDAPRYGAERRGAPVFACVRAARHAIYERGLMAAPDLVVVADDSLVAVPACGVMQGLGPHSVLLISSGEPAAQWRARLNWPGRVVVLSKPSDGARDQSRYVGAACAGAAARLVGVVPLDDLLRAVEDEYASMGAEIVQRNRAVASAAYDAMEKDAGIVRESRNEAQGVPPPEWVDLPLDPADIAAPAIEVPANSIQVRTGLWRVMRPVIDYDRCRRCWWVCSTFCPDNAISVGSDGRPVIDYDHCKGCMICVAQCPPHAIAAVAEGPKASQAEQAR